MFKITPGLGYRRGRHVPRASSGGFYYPLWQGQILGSKHCVSYIFLYKTSKVLIHRIHFRLKIGRVTGIFAPPQIRL